MKRLKFFMISFPIFLVLAYIVYAFITLSYNPDDWIITRGDIISYTNGKAIRDTDYSCVRAILLILSIFSFIFALTWKEEEENGR